MGEIGGWQGQLVLTVRAGSGCRAVAPVPFLAFGRLESIVHGKTIAYLGAAGWGRPLLCRYLGHNSFSFAPLR